MKIIAATGRDGMAAKARPPRIVSSSKRVWRIRRTRISNDCGTGSTAREDFLKRMLAMASGEDEGANRRRRRRMHPVTVDAILDATAQQYGTSADTYCGYRSGAGRSRCGGAAVPSLDDRDASRVVGSIRIEPSG